MFLGNNKVNDRYKLHLVLVCDESGIFDAFNLVKKHLGSSNEVLLTLVYSISENLNNPLFEKELRILENRYTPQLNSYLIMVTNSDYEIIQEFIEAIINCNSDHKMQFKIFGDKEFVDYLSGVLEYLNVDICQIISNRD